MTDGYGVVVNLAKELPKMEKKLSGNDYDESSNYQLLLRILKEQAVQEKDGSYRLRTKEDEVTVRKTEYILGDFLPRNWVPENQIMEFTDWLV